MPCISFQEFSIRWVCHGVSWLRYLKVREIPARVWKKLSSLSIFHSFLSSISLPFFFWHACTGVSLLVSIRNTLLTIIGRSWSGRKSSKVLTGWSHRACLGKVPSTSRCSSVIMSHCTAVYKVWCLRMDAHKTIGWFSGWICVVWTRYLCWLKKHLELFKLEMESGVRKVATRKQAEAYGLVCVTSRFWNHVDVVSVFLCQIPHMCHVTACSSGCVSDCSIKAQHVCVFGVLVSEVVWAKDRQCELN